MSSTYGNNIRVSIFGQSHSKAIGVTIDGIKAGFKIDMDQLAAFMERRAPGRDAYSTPRKEADAPEFLSGIVDDVTCGAPITAIIYNKDTRSQDYSDMLRCPRPGHSDFTGKAKYGGFEDYRGGGHFSGRLTACMCIAGGIFKQILSQRGIEINAEILEIHGEKEKIWEQVAKAKRLDDSVGGIIGCRITGVPVGIGDPIFDGVENAIAKAVFGIPAVRGIEFGLGFEATKLYGSEHNDSFTVRDGKIVTETNNHGGVLGGITSGMPIEFRVAFKPTPSIARPQKSVDYKTLEEVELVVKGRHDPCIVGRAVPVVEAAAALAIMDLIGQE